ncbi:MAG: protein kinase [Gemmatimonadota bacterium]
MYLIRTLGVLDIRSENGAPVQSVLAQPKRAALLCYLAAARPIGHHSRDSLVAMFWSELDPEHARNALSQGVHFLRRSLGTEAILNRNSDDLAVNRELIRCDAADLERWLERGALDKALALYDGDYLQGFHVSDAPAFERWIDEERTRLRELAAGAATKLAVQLRADGELSSAIEYARRSSALTPYDEQRACTLIELLAAAGQSAAAVTFCESFAKRLWEDLELKPSAETCSLVERIRSADRTLAATRTVGEAPGTPETQQGTGAAASTDPTETLRNELAPELEVLRLLGRGSSAIAYLAREPALKRLVTVKVLRKQLAADPIARQRFEREAQAAARISHTNVASVFRVGRLRDSCPYIVMEYVDGRSLTDTVAAVGPLPKDDARRLLAALASALASAHHEGVIHRDVRPGNIFIENRSGRIVLTDFGIAALRESGGEAAIQLTPAGTQLGEMRYVSPEQARGEVVTELSDVYAFGVVAFELLVGKHPLDPGAGRVDLTGAARAPQQQLAALADLAPDLRNTVERCLSSDPSRRPRAQDVTALLAAIRR